MAPKIAAARPPHRCSSSVQCGGTRHERCVPLRALGHGKAGGDGQAAGVGGVDGLDDAGLERQAQLLAEALDEARDGDRRRR